MTRSRAHRAILLGAAVTLLGACAEVLGITEYSDAVEGLCHLCSGDFPDCREALETKLGEASEADVRAWLQLYSDLGCDKAQCNTAEFYQCFYTAPANCQAEGGACERSEACCGFDFAKPREGAGCCAAGDGTCCAQCLTCAAALGESPPDRDGVCLSQRSALDIVLGCRDAKCKIACATAGAACNTCMLTSCKSQLDACNANKAP